MIESSSTQTIQAAFSSCQAAFTSGKTKPIAWRLAQLKALERMLVEQEATFCEALAKDLGKSAVDAWLLEISFVSVTSRFARKNLSRWNRTRKVTTPAFVKPGRSSVKTEPLGSVLIISPWNYPLQLALAPLVTAIAAGNCVVMKPSELAPATSSAMARVIPEYMDTDCIHVLEGGVEVSTQILELQWDHIVFTGGDHVGKIVMAAAARHLIPVTLELGGKSPCIVLPDADLDIAARRIVWGKFTNAGQTCIAPDHILADQETIRELIPRMQKEVTTMFGSDPKLSADYGRIINENHFDRVCALIESDNVVIGGQTDRSQRFIAPTVLYPATAASPSMQSEIFGPLLPIMEVSGIDQAIEHVLNGAKPLAAYLFTKNDESIRKMKDKVSAGSVCINDVMMFVAVEGLPFGGVGASGMGTYKGEAGFRQLSHEKAVLQRSWWPDLNLRYAPSSKSKNKWLRRIR